MWPKFYLSPFPIRCSKTVWAPPHSQWKEISFWDSSQKIVEARRMMALLLAENCAIPVSVVSSQYKTLPTDDDYDDGWHIMTICELCNVTAMKWQAGVTTSVIARTYREQHKNNPVRKFIFRTSHFKCSVLTLTRATFNVNRCYWRYWKFHS